MSEKPLSEFERESNERVSGGGCIETRWVADETRSGSADGAAGPTSVGAPQSGDDRSVSRQSVLGGMGTTTACFRPNRPPNGGPACVRQYQYANKDLQRIVEPAAREVSERLSEESLVAKPSVAAVVAQPPRAVRTADVNQDRVVMTVDLYPGFETGWRDTYARVRQTPALSDLPTWLPTDALDSRLETSLSKSNMIAETKQLYPAEQNTHLKGAERLRLTRELRSRTTLHYQN